MEITFGTTLYNKLRGDKSLWFILAILIALSLLSVYSASGSWAYRKSGHTEFFFIKQVVNWFIGLVVLYLSYRLHYSRYSQLAPYLLLIAIALLIFTQLFGMEINQARRWIAVPFIGLTFQTSDFAKIALIIFVARSITLRQDNIKDFHSAFIPIMAPIIIVCGLIAPANLSTAALLFATCMVMMFIGRIQLKYILFLLLMGVFVMGLLVLIGTYFLPDLIRVQTWTSRITEFIQSGSGGFQVEQAKIAIANGRWFGLGPGNSLQQNFLPFAYADYIYAIICEEYGLVGAAAVIVLYLWMFVRITSIVTRCPKTFGSLLAMGLGLQLIMQAFANLAVSVNLVPVTGLNLPLISYGGTSMLFTCMTFGIILSVSRYIDIQVDKPQNPSAV